MYATRMIAAAARLTAVVAAAAALSACDVVVNSLESKGQAKDQWTKTYTIAATGDVEIVNANGRIEVTGVEGTQVEIVAERTARAMTDEDAQKVLGGGADRRDGDRRQRPARDQGAEGRGAAGRGHLPRQGARLGERSAAERQRDDRARGPHGDRQGRD